MAIACTGYRSRTRWTLVALLPYIDSPRGSLVSRDELGEPLGVPDTRHVIEQDITRRRIADGAKHVAKLLQLCLVVRGSRSGRPCKRQYTGCDGSGDVTKGSTT